MVCVPMILLTAFTLVSLDPYPVPRHEVLIARTETAWILTSLLHQAAKTGTLIPLPDWLTVPYLELNLGTIAASIYGALYILLEPVAGTALALICIGGTAFGNSLLAANSASTTQWAIAIHVVSWIAQFIGHGAFEGRAPALLDNLVQAVFLAPLFVWLELLFAFGYRPELQRRVEKKVQAEIAKFKAAKANGQVKKAQ